MKNVHFLGICGTAMGAVAAAMARRGFRVTGSDARAYPPMSDFLEKEGIDIREGYSPGHLPADADMIVIGNAMSRGNPEVEAVLERRLRYVSLPGALQEFFLWGRRNYVVTGTHGKTTTTSILAWVMTEAGLDPSFMIGGIARNLGRGGRFTDSEFCVLEGDEYDTAFFDKRSKFLHYLPELAVINNIEFDHADIYGSIEEIELSFRRLVNLVPRNGLVLVNADDPRCLGVTRGAPCPVRSVGTGEQADVRITDIEYRPDGCSWTLGGQRFALPMIGEFNVRNASMAVEAARFAGVSPETAARALARFQGVARRQEVRGAERGVVVVDDFAHHPTAIRQSLAGIRQKYPGARVWAVFEPRSNTTRRNIFQHELADALAAADMPVVASVEDPGKVDAAQRLDVGLLTREISRRGRAVYHGGSVNDIVRHIARESRSGDVVLIMSNGGFGGIHEKLLAALRG
ncbi:MAG: UDP-N-acetylmuramate:L-alanyl-gamma-D-glutamyl-meso-diaminopimelate ligase [Akkermansiaceae bacterium]|nr:UDP-N-acetylmuramate:L-alanyl-gamma-D-glutamyl-meso-diaminopimelate ligase [Akkermansiaceae bacterium]